MGLIQDLERFVKPYSDTLVHTGDSWASRKEAVGNGSVATITSEGQLYSYLNYECGERRYEEAYEKMTAIANRHKCWWQQGYGWTWHFYPKEA